MGEPRRELPHILTSDMEFEDMVRALQTNLDHISGEVGEQRSQLADLDSELNSIQQDIPTSGADIPSGSFPAPPSDGVAPATSPEPSVNGGPRWLSVDWDGVANSDQVTYEIHVGTSAGFAPGGATLAGETSGTLAFIRAVAGTPLAYGTNYWVRIIAKDVDGAAAPSTAVGPTQLSPNDLADFLDGLRPIQRVTSLPTLPDAAYPEGAVVFLATDDKLYRSTGSAWTAAVPAVDLTGQITETQITDDAITTPKLATGAVVTDKLSANAVTAGKIAADTITANEIAAGAISASELAAAAVVAGKIAANAVSTAELAADAVTAEKILAAQITAEHLAAIILEVTKIYSPSATGWRLEIGDAGFPIRYWDGTEIRFFLDNNGNVLARTMQLSAARVTDYVDLDEQAAATPARNATYDVSASGQGVVAPNWGGTTPVGALLVAVVTGEFGISNGSYGPPNGQPFVEKPAGWTLAKAVGGGPGGAEPAVAIYYIANAATRTGSESFRIQSQGNPLLDPVDVRGNVRLMAFTGVAANALDKTASDEGTGTSVSSGTTAAVSQDAEVFVAGLCHEENAARSGGPSNSFTFIGTDSTGSGAGHYEGHAYQKVVAAGGAAAVAQSIDASQKWAGAVVTFRAKSGEPAAAGADTLRVYSKDRGGTPELFIKDENGLNRGPIGRFVGCRVYRNAAFNVTGTLTAISFDAEDNDTDALHDNATNPTRITVPLAGYWQFTGQVRQQGSTTSYVRLSARKNGTTDLTDSSFSRPDGDGGNWSTAVTDTGPVLMSAGDYVEFRAANAGATVAGSPGSIHTFATARYLGP